MLKGFSRIAKAKPDGLCLYNCVSLHIYGDENKAKNIKKIVNNHIYNNWNFYKEKIPLPFRENFVGVQTGPGIICNTEKEFLEFLLSDESMKVFSNFHDILGLSNMYNMKINIFTYGSNISQPRWTTIEPNDELVKDVNATFGKVYEDIS